MNIVSTTDKLYRGIQFRQTCQNSTAHWTAMRRTQTTKRQRKTATVWMKNQKKVHSTLHGGCWVHMHTDRHPHTQPMYARGELTVVFERKRLLRLTLWGLERN